MRSPALAGGSLIAAWGVVAASGSRPAGGVVLLLGGIVCARHWLTHHGRRAALELSGALLGAFVLSHVLALAIGAWPSVLVCAALLAALVARRVGPQGLAPKRS